MKNRKNVKGADAALHVLQRIAQQERLLAQGALFSAMQQAQQAEREKKTLEYSLESYHLRLSQDWRIGARHAVNQAMSSLGYRHWLGDEIDKATENVASCQEEVEIKREEEARLRAQSRLLDTLVERRYERARDEATKKSYKTLDELILLKARRQPL